MQRQTRVVSGGDGEAQHVELGRLLQGLLLAGALAASVALLGIPLLAYRVSGAEDINRELVKKIERTERSLQRIDTNQRILLQDSAWNGTKLDRLLDAADLDRVPRPPLPESSLETAPSPSAPN